MAVSHGKKRISSRPYKKPLVDSRTNQNWRFYGRRAGRKLNTARQKALDEIYPVLAVPAHTINEDQSCNPKSFFDAPPSRLIFEIGFGNGVRLAEHIKQEPDAGFIGAEPFSNGMSALLSSLDDPLPRNLKLWMDDAMIMVRSFQSHVFDALYILNPDPWHKTRHHKRRLVNEDNLKEFSRLLKPGGHLILTTDVEDLADWMLTYTVRNPDFEWQAQACQDWLRPPANWIPTRYETKGAKGTKEMHYFLFKKRNRAT